MLEDVGILSNIGDDSPIGAEKQLALKEIMELNKERIRKDDLENLTYVVPDEKRKIKRLEEFVNAFHDVLEFLDFGQIFVHY